MQPSTYEKLQILHKPHRMETHIGLRQFATTLLSPPPTLLNVIERRAFSSQRSIQFYNLGI